MGTKQNDTYICNMSMSLYREYTTTESKNDDFSEYDIRLLNTVGELIEESKQLDPKNKDYKGTASLYDVSYSQVYSWVKKYVVTGEEGLLDKRGCHKTDDEVDELERLRRENKRLKRQLEENDMLVQLLKKVKEFEGM